MPFGFTIKLCRCDARREAQVAGEFLYSETHHAWIAPDAPVRRVRDPWKLAWHGTENHDGEPMQWVCCPWCGYDLPMCHLEPPRLPPPTGEGSEA